METTAKKGGDSLRWCLSGVITGGLTLAALLLLCAWLLAGGTAPVELMEELTVACLFASAAAGGFVAARRRGRGVLAAGAAAGAAAALLLTLAAALSPEGRAVSPENLRSAIACVAGGCFGGTLLLKKPTIRAKKRKGRR